MSGKPITVDDEGRLSFETDPEHQAAEQRAYLQPCAGGCSRSIDEVDAAGLGHSVHFTTPFTWQCDDCDPWAEPEGAPEEQLERLRAMGEQGRRLRDQGLSS